MVYIAIRRGLLIHMSESVPNDCSWSQGVMRLIADIRRSTRSAS